MSDALCQRYTLKIYVKKVKINFFKSKLNIYA